MEKVKKQEIIKKFARTEGDVGSTEVQVAVLTSRITELTQHLREHKKDNSTRRGLIALVNRRRKLLKYLSGKDTERYQGLVRELNLRH